MSEPRKIGSGPGLELYESGDMKSVFADGANSFVFVSGVTKIAFFESSLPPAFVEGSPEAPRTEQRVVNVQVTMPTVQFLEFCVHSIERFQMLRDQVVSGKSEEARRAAELLDRLVLRQ